MKVLIVDDDQLTAATWAMGLKSAGLEVITATNGQDGINQVKTQKPDMVLLDQIMPDMLGNAVLTQLKSDPETAPIPVMLISNYNENQMMKEAIEKGAVDYILKYQIETKDLVDKVKTTLTELGGSAAQAAPPAPTQDPAQQQGQPAPMPGQPSTPPQPAAPVNPSTPETPAQNDNNG
jgi:twitching motility two-component system response regulator PilH